MHHRNVCSRPLKRQILVSGEKTEYNNTKEMYGHTVLLAILMKRQRNHPSFDHSFVDFRLAIILHQKCLPSCSLPVFGFL